MRRSIPIAAALLTCALAVPSMASAVDYPPAEKPGTPQTKPKGPHKTYKVCPKLTSKAKKQGCKFTVIQAAVDKAKAGDTVKVADGTYGEGVVVRGPEKRYLKITGNTKNPAKVVIDASKIPAKPKYKSTLPSKYYDATIQKSNAIAVNSANEVDIRGFTAKNQKANGFFFLNVDGYNMQDLVANKTGVYGLYVFHSVGGTISDSTGFHTNDSAFYIGETPPQDKPKRTIVKNIKSYGNVLGWSGTNMRYVTITKSYFWNNGAGIVPNALPSEDFPPPEDNIITDNDIFLNNFNYYAGAPFTLRPTKADGIPFPVGVGVLIFGGRRNVVENNRIYGNKLLGAGAIEGLAVKGNKDFPGTSDLIANKIRGNTFGNNGANRNGRDLGYDGNGTGNCLDPNQVGAQTLFPDANVLGNACGSDSTPNTFSSAAQGEAVGWAVAKDHTSSWITYDQAPVKDPLDPSKNVVPLETYQK
jgi:hypothetical protein